MALDEKKDHNHDAAIAKYQKATELDPKYAGAYYITFTTEKRMRNFARIIETATERRIEELAMKGWNKSRDSYARK
jgi:TPR repeat